MAWQAPSAIRARSVTWRRALAALSALLAALAGAAPTGWSVADVVLTAAVGGLVVVFAFRAKPATVAVASLVTAAAATGSPAPVQALALAAAGLALATAFTARRGPTATALVGAGLVQALLRLQPPATVAGIDVPHGATAALGVVVLGVVGVSGYRRMRRGDQRTARRAAFVVAGATAVAAGLGILAVADARASLERGIDRAGAGLGAAKRADQAGAKEALDEAEDAFADAGRTLDAPWVRPALAVPVVAQHVRVLQAVATSGHELSDAGVAVAGAANLDGIRVEDGNVPLDVVEALDEPLRSARRALDASTRRLEEARSAWLVPPIRARLDRQLGRLDDAAATTELTSDAVSVLPDLLGASGTRRWFLAVMTPVEGRSAGGFMGNWGELTADAGRISLTRFGRVAELNAAGAAAKQISGPPDFLRRYGRFAPEVTWQNVAMTPDFPTMARVVGEMYPQSGGEAVDGVIGITPTGLAALLRLTGPVEVPGWPEPFTADNVEHVLHYDQYVRFQTPERIDLLGDAAERIFRRLTSMDLPPAQEVLDALGPAVAGRHLQIASLDDGEAEVLDRLGVDGSFPAVADDFVSVTTQNGSGNKIEWFLRRAVDHRVDLGGLGEDGTGPITATTTVTLTNTAPASGLPPYLIGGPAEVPDGTTRLYVTVYSPWGLAGARINGQPVSVGSERELGRWAYSTFVEIAAGDSLTFEIDLEGSVEEPVGATFDVAVHHQPTVAPDDVTVAIGGARRSRPVDGDTTFRLPRPAAR